MTKRPLRASLLEGFQIPAKAPSFPASEESRNDSTVWPKISRVIVRHNCWKLCQPRIWRSYISSRISLFLDRRVVFRKLRGKPAFQFWPPDTRNIFIGEQTSAVLFPEPPVNWHLCDWPPIRRYPNRRRDYRGFGKTVNVTVDCFTTDTHPGMFPTKKFLTVRCKIHRPAKSGPGGELQLDKRTR